MDNLDRLSFDFFKLFSRMEYALKAASFHRGEGTAPPDWTKFSQDIDAKFQAIKNEKLDECRQYILAHPPKKQVIREEKIVWSDTPPRSENNTDLLLLYVRRVRNNLFHGGKFNGNWFEPERCEELLNSSKVILEHALASNEKVKEAFENDA
ncbi:hypothetical protein LRP50_21670 [Enterovibrio sp. ZSDZ42]|uniref:Apea-like HEPN domain-containing protein n=1 Tax=Enterovibrio gelatinilyticus TaxID=2899819 RepID=A0ABT5R622_9GAMM|nr:hypothetical protein [Enterovibrio sp. ZSDZ42]MDD1795733.1 hypothetical protein [Enterovibrio sp. ZSDZ42]